MILVRKPPGLFFEKSKNQGFKRRVRRSIVQAEPAVSGSWCHPAETLCRDLVIIRRESRLESIMLLIVIDTANGSGIALWKDQAVRKINAIVFLPERELYTGNGGIRSSI